MADDDLDEDRLYRAHLCLSEEYAEQLRAAAYYGPRGETVLTFRDLLLLVREVQRRREEERRG